MEGNVTRATGRSDPMEGDIPMPDEVSERAQDLAEDRDAEKLPLDAALDGDAGSSPEPFDGSISTEQRRRMIAEAAYYIALRRGLSDGFELDDWLAAESEVSARLGSRQRS